MASVSPLAQGIERPDGAPPPQMAFARPNLRQLSIRQLSIGRFSVRFLCIAVLIGTPIFGGLAGCSEELFAHRDDSASRKALYFPDPHPIENYNRYGQATNNPQNFSNGASGF